MSDDTPLKNQERCACGRLLASSWQFCPGCGIEQQATATDGGVADE